MGRWCSIISILNLTISCSSSSRSSITRPSRIASFLSPGCALGLLGRHIFLSRINVCLLSVTDASPLWFRLCLGCLWQSQEARVLGLSLVELNNGVVATLFDSNGSLVSQEGGEEVDWFVRLTRASFSAGWLPEGFYKIETDSET